MIEGARQESGKESTTTRADAAQADAPNVYDASVLEKLTTPLFGPYREMYEREQQKPLEPVESDIQAATEISATNNYAGTLKRVGRMIWQNAKTTALIQGAASVIESGAALASFYYGAQLFRSFETVYQGGAAGSDLVQNLSIVVGLGCVAAYGPVSKLVQSIFHSHMQVGFDREVMNAIASRRQSELETESLRKELTTIRENQWRLPQFASGMLQSSGKAVELVFAGGLLSYVASQSLGAGPTIAMAGVLVAATVPRILSEFRHAKDVLQVEEKIANLRRKSWYLTFFATENDNVRELKNLGREKEIQDRAISHVAGTLEEQIAAEKRNASQQLYSHAVTRATALGCAAVFVAKAWSGQLAPEVLGVATGALYRFDGALSNISTIIGEQLKHFQFAHRTATLIDESEKAREQDEKKRVSSFDFSASPAPIILADVSYTYQGKEKPAVNSVSLTVAPGEFVAVVGPNGCGKTTLAKLVRGMYPPDSGVVSYGGIDLETAKFSELSSYVASTGQDGKLFESLSVKESVELGAPPGRDGIPFAAAMQYGLADTFVATLRDGVDTINGNGFEGGQELSSGQRQMVLASRTFRRDPKIMILDEPGSNLDPQHDAELARNLDSFKSSECTRILITHNLRAAAKRADRIIVMEDGVVAAQGTHEELVASNEWYRESYELQENGSKKKTENA